MVSFILVFPAHYPMSCIKAMLNKWSKKNTNDLQAISGHKHFAQRKDFGERFGNAGWDFRRV